MDPDADRRELLRLQVEVERADDLVERGLGGTVGVPAAETVVRHRTDTSRDVDPLGETGGRVPRFILIGLGGARRGGRWQEAGEVLDEEHVRYRVQLERLHDLLEIQVRRLSLGVEQATEEKRDANVGRVGGEL